jgi:hypothetical protein
MRIQTGLVDTHDEVAGFVGCIHGAVGALCNYIGGLDRPKKQVLSNQVGQRDAATPLNEALSTMLQQLPVGVDSPLTVKRLIASSAQADSFKQPSCTIPSPPPPSFHTAHKRDKIILGCLYCPLSPFGA